MVRSIGLAKQGFIVSLLRHYQQSAFTFAFFVNKGGKGQQGEFKRRLVLNI